MIVKTTTRTRLMLAAAGLAALLFAPSARAQTYTWADNAQGQVYLICPEITPSQWPSNTLWSQSAHTNWNCDETALVADQPSNFDPWPPVGIYPGGPGATGVDVVLGPPANTVLDANATLNSLTLLANGGLTVNQTLTASLFDLQGGGSITGVGAVDSTGYGGALVIASGGSLTKSAGDGTFSFGIGQPGVTLSGYNCTLIVQSGTLEMPFAGGNGGTLYNATLALSNNASVLLQAPDSYNYEHGFIGTLTGTGAGTFLWNQGQIWCSGWDPNGHYLQAVTLNFPANMFQWSGGAFSSGAATNIGVINITNTGAWLYGTPLVNHGIVNFAPGSVLYLYGGPALNNQADGSTYLLGDADITGDGQVYNYGLIRKTAGTGTSYIYPQFWQYSGTVEVDSGTLALTPSPGGLSYFTNATFVVSNGATLDLVISNHVAEIEGTLTGSGGGTVLVEEGTLESYYGAVLNFPGAMFQWQGGVLVGSSPMLNVGTINVSGLGNIAGWLTNRGTMAQSGSGSIQTAGSLYNDASGVYDIQNDNAISLGNFYNYGQLKKTAGAGTNSFNANTLFNYGSITATSGGLSFGGGYFNQNAGTLQLTPALTFSSVATLYLNGGTITGVGALGGNQANDSVEVYGGVLAPGNPYGSIDVPNNFQVLGGALNIQLGGPSQFSRVTAGTNAYLQGGTLNVTVAHGYSPPVGTQFQVLSCPVLSGGGFATLNVPRGISVTYSNDGVYLIVTPPPAQISGPRLSSQNFVFSFGTLSNQSYTVEANTDLATRNWLPYTNIIGDGLLHQIVVPAQNPPRSFFRVREP